VYEVSSICAVHLPMFWLIGDVILLCWKTLSCATFAWLRTVSRDLGGAEFSNARGVCRQHFVMLRAFMLYRLPFTSSILWTYALHSYPMFVAIVAVIYFVES